MNFTWPTKIVDFEDLSLNITKINKLNMSFVSFFIFLIFHCMFFRKVLEIESVIHWLLTYFYHFNLNFTWTLYLDVKLNFVRTQQRTYLSMILCKMEVHSVLPSNVRHPHWSPTNQDSCQVRPIRGKHSLPRARIQDL